MRNKSLLVLGAGAALIALTACGPTNITGSAAPHSAGNQAATGQGDGTQASSLAELGSAVSHNASQQNSVHVDMDVQAAGQKFVAAGDMKFAGAQSAVHLTMNVADTTSLEMVLVDGSLYMKLPAGTTPKPWVQFDTTGSDALSKAFGSTAQLAQQSDPSKLIDRIKSAGTITKVSREQIDGQDTTHYTITVDIKKLVAGLPTDDLQKQALGQLSMTTLPFDLWVNSANLPVRISTQMASPGLPGAAPIMTSVIANYTKWGQPVTIVAPPADQVSALGGH